ncbi:DUF4394 domain-containing protein [Argonema antarcticum]|uniref:DUF4394 domain-containing protein n=1 Tax=Argonema antarcticum TaxID=2942763 RepID=UPI00201218B3|nr:DUF4394 domain-containing protein [Argonema antarcticum]MCL1469381.1 DUF4394 domain-containing protein [Argonema antarcticum A004/B2]
MTVNLFDVNYYRGTNPDLRTAGLTTDTQLVDHFLRFGINDGRPFSPFVNLDFYRAGNPDLAAGGVNSNLQAFYHLQSFGIADGRRFSYGLNVPFYAAVNPDLALAGINNNEQRFEHFRSAGINDGRVSAENFNVRYYLDANPDLRAAGLNFAQAFQHYVNYGFREGRPAVPRLIPSFISTSSGQIGTIDPLTATFREIARGPAFTDIALSNDGRLFGITSNDLHRIDPITGASSRIGSLGAGFFNALGFSADNRLYAAARNSNLYTVDPFTGTVSSVANLGSSFSSSGDIVFDPVNNRFLATSDGVGSDVLFSIGLNGTATRIGNIGFSGVFGLDFENGILLGYTANRQQITLNPGTGSGTFSKNVTGVSGEIFGAT